MHAAWSVHLRLDLAKHCLLMLSAPLAQVHLWAVDSCSEPALTVKILPLPFPWSKFNRVGYDYRVVCCAAFTKSTLSDDSSNRFAATP